MLRGTTAPSRRWLPYRSSSPLSSYSSPADSWESKSMADLILENLTIAYGDVVAVDNISLSVPSGEFLTLLGPSGCGKSTTLFSIAGLNDASSGVIRIGDTVLFDGQSGTSVEPEHRNIGLVFQSYALWPHMSVKDNLAFPLKLRKIARPEREQRIKEALSLVEMEA